MIDDFELIVHKFNDREDRHIYLLGDVHLGAKECLEAEFAKFLLPAGVAGAHIKTTLTAYDPVQFTIMSIGTSGNVKILPMPAYTVDYGVTKLSIDIGELIAGVILDIDLPSGLITIKESK